MIMSTKEICKRGLSMTISLTLGNTALPLGHRLPADLQSVCEGVLGKALFLPQPPDGFADGHSVHLAFLI